MLGIIILIIVGNLKKISTPMKPPVNECGHAWKTITIPTAMALSPSISDLYDIDLTWDYFILSSVKLSVYYVFTKSFN